jgi:feruloyl esterase
MASSHHRPRGAAATSLAALLALTASALSITAAQAASCSSITAANVPLPSPASVVSLTATDVAASGAMPAYCNVSMVLSSDGDAKTSQIAVQVWLPENGWNGRFLGTGNGGLAGSISTGALQQGVAEGFATANTDMGTGLLFGCNALNCGNHTGQGKPGGLYGDPAAIHDFGYAATHLMTVAGQELTDFFYSRSANRSYFAGCSTGGNQALMESQRFPDDYDGILAGAPAHNRTHLHMAGPAVYEVTHTTPDAYLTDAALGLVHQTVLQQCAGHDGGLATDDFLTLPASCTTNAAVLECKGAANEVPCTDPAAASCTCLTKQQAAAMNHDWKGAEDSLGRRMYPGAERGTEEPVALAASNAFIGNLGLPWQQAQTEPVFDSLIFWALGPKWVWQEMFTTTSVPEPESAAEIQAIDDTKIGNSTFAKILNANSTNLKQFKQHGGRILMYQGYADPLIPSATAIDYYNAVAAADPSDVANYLRLFMVPGMWHCSGGPGANVFGGASSATTDPLDPAVDALGALVFWVENGVPPTQITATKYVNDNAAQGIAFQRPLCLYPAHAAYVSGDPTSAASYTCAASPPVTNQAFSPIYGP